MQTREVDVLVIGAGTAGLNAVAELRKTDRDWMLVDSGPLGTTCARVGCMPSKLLIAAGDRAQAVREAGEFGIAVENFSVDAQAVFSRLRTHRDRFVAGVIDGMDKLPEDRIIRGAARFSGPTRVQIECENETPLRVEARAVVIATGARPRVPPVFQKLGRNAWLSDDVFELDALPARLAVVGTGAIGLELGQALQRLGVAVDFFSNEALIGPLQDPEIQQCVRETLGADHRFHLQADIEEVEEREEGGVRMAWKDRGGQRHVQAFERILLATGRVPRIGGLDLENTGLALNEHGMPEDWDPCTTQCGSAPIFLAGDASHHRPLMHEAVDEGRIAGRNAAHYPETSENPRRTPLAIVFSHPQMATVGAAFETLDEGEFETGSVSFANQGRARVLNANQGMMRLYAERSSCTLAGAELFGPGVEHLAHLLAWSVQQGLTVKDLLSMPFYHPVLEEALRTALKDLSRRLDIEERCRCYDVTVCPGE